MRNLLPGTVPQRFLFLFCFVFCLPAFWVNIKDHTDWGDDYAMYLLQAENLLQGKPQSENGYLYQDYAKGLGPKAYPPGFPIMLSILMALKGFDVAFFLSAVSVMSALWFVFSFFLFRRELPPFWIGILLLWVFYGRYFLLFKSELLSEIPYAAVSFAALYGMSRYPAETFSPFKLSVLLCFVLTAILFRSSGWLLLPVLWIYFLRSSGSGRNKFMHLASTGLIPFAYFALGKMLGMPSGGAYTDQATFVSYETLWRNFSLYAKTLSSPFIPHEIAGGVLSVLSAAVLVVACIYRLLKSPAPFDYYFAGYLILLLVWPHYTLRFVIPVLPLVVFYFFFSIRLILKRVDHLFISGVVISAGVFWFFIQAPKAYSEAVTASHTISDGPFDASAREVFSFIRDYTAESDGVAFVKPRVSAFFAKRRSLILSSAFSEQENRLIMKENGVRYILLFREGYPYQEGNELALGSGDGFELIFENDRFRLFEMY